MNTWATPPWTRSPPWRNTCRSAPRPQTDPHRPKTSIMQRRGWGQTRVSAWIWLFGREFLHLTNQYLKKLCRNSSQKHPPVTICFWQSDLKALRSKKRNKVALALSIGYTPDNIPFRKSLLRQIGSVIQVSLSLSHVSFAGMFWLFLCNCRWLYNSEKSFLHISHVRSVVVQKCTVGNMRNAELSLVLGMNWSGEKAVWIGFSFAFLNVCALKEKFGFFAHEAF